MRSLDLDQLRTFVIAADLRSFTAAGDCLNATQSAVSLRIAKLEGQLGRTLLARTPRSVSLTPEGARFLEHARAILDAHDAALSQLTAADVDTGSVLRLAVSDHAVGAGLASVLASLKAALPGQKWEVTVGLSAEMRNLYDAGDADAAIVRQDAASDAKASRCSPTSFAGWRLRAQASPARRKVPEPCRLLPCAGHAGLKQQPLRLSTLLACAGGAPFWEDRSRRSRRPSRLGWEWGCSVRVTFRPVRISLGRAKVSPTCLPRRWSCIRA